jgi:small GTP-binding protein
MPGKLIKKVCLLGDSSVGKTSLIKKYVYDTFDDKYIATIGTKTVKKELQVDYFGKPLDLTLMIWDILGQKEYRRVQAMSFEGTSGALMVSDVTRPETLQSLKEYWAPQLKKVAGNVPMVFLANKVDLVDSANLELSELAGLADSFQGRHFLTSAKTGENVDNAFLAMGRQIMAGKGGEEVHLKTEKKRLTPGEVMDNIFGHFVDGFGQDTDYAMAVLRKQCDVVGLDIKAPTQKAMLALIDRLAQVEADVLSPAQISKNKVDRRNYIMRM